VPEINLRIIATRSNQPCYRQPPIFAIGVSKPFAKLLSNPPERSSCLRFEGGKTAKQRRFTHFPSQFVPTISVELKVNDCNGSMWIRYPRFRLWTPQASQSATQRISSKPASSRRRQQQRPRILPPKRKAATTSRQEKPLHTYMQHPCHPHLPTHHHHHRMATATMTRTTTVRTQKIPGGQEPQQELPICVTTHVNPYRNFVRLPEPA